MPYLLISTQIRLESGPTLCGDEQSDPGLMRKLGATLQMDSGKKFKLYVSPQPVRAVLDKLEQEGYRVLATCGVGQTCVWTLHKEAAVAPPADGAPGVETAGGGGNS